MDTLKSQVTTTIQKAINDYQKDGQFGIDNITIVLMLLCEILNVIPKAVAASGWDKLIVFKDIFDELLAFFKINFKAFVDEIKELGPNDRQELINQFKIKFDIERDDIEAVVEETIDTLNSLSNTIVKLINLAKTLKPKAA